MESVKVEGVVYKLHEVREISATFKTQTVVVKVEDKYPQFLSVEFTQDRVKELSMIKEGDLVTVNVNLRGKQYFDKRTNEEKFFNKLDGWKCEIRSLEDLSDKFEADLKDPDLRSDLPF